MRRWRCRQWHARLVDYVGGALAADGRERVEGHLARCARCAAAVAAMREVPSALRGMDGPARDEEFWQRQRRDVMRRIGQTADADERRRSVWSVAWRPALVAVTAVLLAVAASQWMRPPAERVRGVASDLDALDEATLLALAGGVEDLVQESDLASHVAQLEDEALLAMADQPWVLAEVMTEPPAVGDLGDDELATLEWLLGGVGS